MPFHRILVGVDGSPGGEAATRLGGQLAALGESDVLLVHVVPLPPIVPAIDQAISEASLSYLEDEAERAVARAAAALDEMGVKHEEIIRPGSPADVMLSVAAERDADLIVVGHRGFGAVKRLILGSVSSKLAHHVSCALLLAPVPDEE
jgi:nucleotide-binding universal stress UspA family protein